MTPAQRAIGFTATLVIALILITAIINEPQRQEIALEEHIEQSINSVIDIYAYNCVECHGAAGEGFDIYPDLTSDSIRLKDAEQLYRSIERGRAGTEMAAFGLDEGGMLTGVQVDGLVKLIQYGDWSIVKARVAQLDLLPTTTPTPTVTPTLTDTPTLTATHTLAATATASNTATQAPPSPTQTESGLFGIVPSDIPTGAEGDNTSPFIIVPTDTPTTAAGQGRPFSVIPTDTPSGSGDQSSPFDVVPTATDDAAGQGSPFDVEPTTAEADAANQVSPFQVQPTDSER